MGANGRRTFYVIAVGGTAMTPLASLLVERGEHVVGSDLLPLYPPMSDRIEALGIPVLPGFSAGNLPERIDHVVVGNLASRDNPELLEAQRRGLTVTSMPETLFREFLARRHPIVVAGTHGKTTTTALTAFLLASAGRDPGYLIGGEPLDLPGPSAVGSGPAFVVEGDEYSTSFADRGPKFLHYGPRTLILTSVEFDHADLYSDLEAVKSAFRKVVALVPPDGLIVANGDAPDVLDVLEGARAPIRLYRVFDQEPPRGDDGPEADLVAVRLRQGDFGALFDVYEQGRLLLPAGSRMAGRHNVANALAAIGAVRGLGLSGAEIAAGLGLFRGVKRRLEVKGERSGVVVLDDFAHHPTAVAATIEGARGRFPGRRLWAVFEPRSITGGRADFEADYRRALAGADGAVVAVPYHQRRLAGSGGPGALDAHRLALELSAAGVAAFAGEGADHIVEELLPRLREGDVVLVMSSGSFGGLCGKLLEALGRPAGEEEAPFRPNGLGLSGVAGLSAPAPA